MKIKKLLMKEHPILFSTPMVQAILDDRKRMTRRLNGLDKINLNPEDYKLRSKKLNSCFVDNKGRSIVYFDKSDGSYTNALCPYGQIGDILWVREAMVINKNSETYWPVADGYIKTADYEKVVPSIHVPKINSRIWLKITSVKVERLRDISQEDALKEGLLSKLMHDCIWFDDYLQPNTFPHIDPRDSFRSLWISINGLESWEANPWVWAIEFEVLSTTGKPTEI